MIVLQAQHLSAFLEELYLLWPQSLPVYKDVENQILPNSNFAWPGLEFVVDQFPNFNACIVRPTPRSQEYVPRRNRAVFNIAGKSPDALKNLLEEPGVIDWTHAAYFQAIPEELSHVLLEVSQKYGRTVGPQQRADFAALGYIIRTNQVTSGVRAPEGFQLRPLNRAEMEKVNSIWRFAGTSDALKYLLHLHDHKFPTMGLFTPDNEMVGYALCSSEMALAAAYVSPEHRNRGFFQLIAYEWCREMSACRQNLSYAFVSKENVPSSKSLLRLGAEAASWSAVWLLYVPENPAVNDPLVDWYKQLGGLIWKQ